MNQDFFIKDSRKMEHIAHPTTAMMLSMLGNLEMDEQGVVLDIGCGSGILSLAVAHQWPSVSIIASDLEKLAASEAQENIEYNGFSKQIQCVQAEGLDHQAIEQAAPYDLIMANLLVKWHMKYLRQMQAVLKPNGQLMLSGMQAWEVDALLAALPYAKLKVQQQMESEGWAALLLDQR